MKKILIFLLIMTLSIVTLFGCGGQEANVYDKLNDLTAKVEYFQMSVETETDGEKLTSTYDVSYTDDGYTVDYNYEILNVIDLTNPNPTEYKSVKTGSATVEDGEVVEFSGDQINVIPKELGFSFKEEYFSSIKTSNGSFTAQVENDKKFLGERIDADDLKVVVKYSEESFTRITITYTTQESSVTVKYTFD